MDLKLGKYLVEMKVECLEKLKEKVWGLLKVWMQVVRKVVMKVVEMDVKMVYWKVGLLVDKTVASLVSQLADLKAV